MSNNRYEEAMSFYRTQMLDAIAALISPHPFAAVTLACCSIDFLANVLRGDRSEDFIDTVKARLEGYSEPGIPEYLYELRSGLVHEFRTHTEDGSVPIALSGSLSGPPQWEKGTLLISVSHFCAAVQAAFTRFFQDATANERRRFTGRAFIYVKTFEVRLDPRAERDATPPGPISTQSTAASGTGGPFPPDDNSHNFGF